jgi:uncharacterized protein YijF (DUF1287 family)
MENQGYRLNRIKKGISEIRDMDPHLEVFGAENHDYELNPCLSPEYIADIEKDLSIQLPEEYSAFLLNAGNGGAGPGNGLFSLEYSLARIGMFYQEPDFDVGRFLCAEFRKPDTPEDARSYDNLPPGLLPICDLRFGSTVCLAVSGMERGTLWLWSDDNILIPYPPREIVRRMIIMESSIFEFSQNDDLIEKALNLYHSHKKGFLDWYEDWVESGLKGDLPKTAEIADPFHFSRQNPEITERQMRYKEKTGNIIMAKMIGIGISFAILIVVVAILAFSDLIKLGRKIDDKGTSESTPQQKNIYTAQNQAQQSPKPSQSLSFREKLVESAIERTRHKVTYDPAYVVIDYPGGDVPPDKGICCDVIIRAYRSLGIDLQKEVHEDIKANFDVYPSKKIWDLTAPDKNIDHRRVQNLMTFFERKGKALPITENGGDYHPGDIVTWRLPSGMHIGIVIDRMSPDKKRPLIVHNCGNGPVIQDFLFSYPITGHYVYSGGKPIE